MAGDVARWAAAKRCTRGCTEAASLLGPWPQCVKRQLGAASSAAPPPHPPLRSGAAARQRGAAAARRAAGGRACPAGRQPATGSHQRPSRGPGAASTSVGASARARGAGRRCGSRSGRAPVFCGVLCRRGRRAASRCGGRRVPGRRQQRQRAGAARAAGCRRRAARWAMRRNWSAASLGSNPAGLPAHW